MKKTIVLSAMLLSGYNLMAQKFELISQNDQNVGLSHELKEEAFEYSIINNQQHIDFAKSHQVLMMDEGSPALPLFNTSIQLPAKGNPVLVVDYDEVIEIQNVFVAPSKGNLKRNVSPSAVPFSFGTAYQQDAFFPANVATLNDPFVWRTMRGQTVTVSPYQYNPVTKVLRIHKNLRVRVLFQENIEGINETEVSEIDKVLGRMQQRMVLNPANLKYTAVEEDGEMLIITDPDYEAAIAPLARWKNEKGIKTTIVNTTSTGIIDTDIKAYIDSFYTANPDLVYILLVGDHADVPSHTYGTSGGEQLWSDSYYGQLAGGTTDYHPEVFVGRFSGNAYQVDLMVDRTLEYEKNPAAGDWMEKAIGLGSGEGDGIGNDGEADWEHLRNIRTVLMNYGYTTVHEFYDGSRGGDDASGNPSATIITPAVNAGVGLFNYTGHGDQNTCVTGNYSSTNVNSATNNGMYPLVISVACNNGTFTSGTCISETWMRSENASTAAGAIGAAGSSILMAWAQPMQTQDEMAEIIAESYPTNLKTTTGGLFYNSQLSMLEQYPSGASGREVMQTWVYFGDPSTEFRNKQTLNMTVTHVSQVPLYTSSITVNCDVEGATICISQNYQIVGKGIVSGGQAVITFDPLYSDLPLTVTGTKQNYRPYQGYVQVGSGPMGVNEIITSVKMYPNPAKDVIQLTSDDNSIESAELISLTGIQVGVMKAVNGNISFDLSNVASGSYQMRISTSKGVVIKKLEVVK